MNSHPSRDELEAFVCGRLIAERSLQLDAHLDGCADCAMILSGLIDAQEVTFGSMDSAHPDRDTLAAFVGGRLPASQARRIDAHVGMCAACATILEGIIVALESHAGSSGQLVPPGYELIGEIGRGGMGVVYRARRHSDGVEVAIKTLLPEHRGNPTLANYLKHEATITARIRHLRVLAGAQFRRFSVDDPTPYIELPWVPGHTLAQVIGHALARKNLRHMLEWLIQCCQAVEAMHQHDPPIVHFDLKPENLLIYDRDGEAVLIDLGLASECPLPGSVSRIGCGTPAYMAPEVAAPGDAIGPWTDVFALGGILCAVLTGKPPYSIDDFGSREGVREAARKANLAPALRRLRTCGESPDIVSLTMRCLSVSPADRPVDAGEVRQELARILSQLPQNAVRMNLIGATGPFTCVITVGVALVLLVLCVGGGYDIWKGATPPTVPTPPPKIVTKADWRLVQQRGGDPDRRGLKPYRVRAVLRLSLVHAEMVEWVAVSYDGLPRFDTSAGSAFIKFGGIFHEHLQRELPAPQASQLVVLDRSRADNPLAGKSGPVDVELDAPFNWLVYIDKDAYDAAGKYGNTKAATVHTWEAARDGMRSVRGKVLVKVRGVDQPIELDLPAFPTDATITDR